VRKGFLNNVSKGQSLYGEEGSAEGVVPDGAGDPLGYLPKSFREKCKVVDTSKLSQDQQQEAYRQYSETGSSTYAEPGMAMKKKQEAENTKFWDAKREATRKARETGESKMSSGFLNNMTPGHELYGAEGSKEGKQLTTDKKASNAQADVMLKAAGNLLGERGLDDMQFDDFMKAMGDNEIDPEEFSSQMRSLADLLEEGGAAKFDQDVKDSVEEATQQHQETTKKATTTPKPPKASGPPTSAVSNDIWSMEEIAEEVSDAAQALQDFIAADDLEGSEADAEAGLERFLQYRREAEKRCEAEATAAAAASSDKRPVVRSQVLKGEDLEDDKLQVTIELPELNTTADVDLDVTKRSLSLQVEGLYKLDLPLDHDVDEDSVTAKFDKAAKQLVICIPIKY